MPRSLKHIHHWDVLARSCIDGRFIKRTIDWIVERTGGVFDFRTGIGSTKAILESSIDRQSFFKVIETSVKLHKIKEVWLIDHTDCGAYGGSKSFENEEEEKVFHVAKLNQAAETVQKQFPKLKIKKVYVGWEEIEEIG